MRSIAKLFGMRKKRPSFTSEAVDLYSTDKWNHTNMNGMKKLIKHLDVRLNDSNLPALPYNLFDDIEITEDIANVIELVDSDQVTDTYLQAIPSIQYLSMAFKRLIITHEPIIPYDYYDHFLSPVANYDKLIPQINKSNHYFLDYVMNFLSKLVLNPNQMITVKYLGKTIGIYLLRAENMSLYKRNDVDDMRHRQDVFARLMEKYCDIQQQNMKQKASLDSSSVASQSPPSQPPSIQDRSIKVSFLNPRNRPSQEFLQNFFSQYGNVVNVGLKEKLAVILFAEVDTAQRCLDEDVAEKLGKDYKIKYLGNKGSKDTLNNTTLASADNSVIDPVTDKTEVGDIHNTTVNQSQDIHSSSLPPKQALPSGSTKKPEVSVSGIAAVNSSDGGSKASTIPAKHTAMNESSITEDSFRLARQQPEESLGIVDVSMISRHEDHNITKMTLPSGEKPIKPVKPLKPKGNTKDPDTRKLSDEQPYSPAGMITHDRVNSSFISDASSDVSEDGMPSSNQIKPMKIAPMLTKGDSFLSKDSSITMIDLIGEGEEKDKRREISPTLKPSGWKTAQSTEKINSYPSQPVLTSYNSFTNASVADSLVSESIMRTRTLSSEDDTSYTESQQVPLPMLADKATSVSSKSHKFPTPTPIITDREESNHDDDHSHNIVQTSYTPSHQRNSQVEDSTMKENVSPTTTTKRSIKTIQVGSSPDHKTFPSPHLRYDSSSGADPVVTTTLAERDTEEVTPTPVSSSAHFLQQHQVEDLHHRIQYLESKCQHYELSISHYKEIIHQNESLFRQRLIQLELSNQQLVTNLQQQNQEIIQYKSELLNKTIYISSLESIQQSLEQQRQQIETKMERQSLATVLSQKKLIENLQLHLSVLQQEQVHSENHIQQLETENQQLIADNLSLKETILLQEQQLQEFEEKEKDPTAKNNFQYHYPTNPRNTTIRSKSSQPLEKEKDEEDDSSNPANTTNHQSSKIQSRSESSHHPPPLSVLESLSQSELKSYLSKVATNSGLQYERLAAREGSDGITPVIQRSELTHRLPSSFTSSTTKSFPQHQSYSGVTEQNQKELKDKEGAITSSSQFLPPKSEEVEYGTIKTVDDESPKLSYSAQLLLNYEKQKRKHQPVQKISESTLPPAPTTEKKGTPTDTPPEEYRPSELKKDSLSDMYAMKNYLSELSQYGRPRDQMTFYNHLQGETGVTPPRISTTNSDSMLPYESRVPKSSYNPERQQTNDTIEHLPSIYSMTQDLKQLTQSVLPPATTNRW